MGRALPIDLEVVKRVPVGGGLGGGSSDAAATMIGVDQLFGLGMAPNEMRDISMRLGSDVAFFLEGGGAIVEGFGDEIERVGMVKGAVTLVVPPFGCPTPEVYRAYDAVLREAVRSGHRVESARVRRAQVESASAGRVCSELLFNDLLAGAERIRPELRSIRDIVREECGCEAHLTGSGSCLFVVGSMADALRRVPGLQPCAIVESRLARGG